MLGMPRHTVYMDGYSVFPFSGVRWDGGASSERYARSVLSAQCHSRYKVSASDAICTRIVLCSSQNVYSCEVKYVSGANSSSFFRYSYFLLIYFIFFFQTRMLILFWIQLCVATFDSNAYTTGRPLVDVHDSALTCMPCST